MVILNTCRYSGSERGIQFGYCEYANSDRLILCGSGVLRFYSLSTQLFPVTEGYVSPQFFSSFLKVKKETYPKIKISIFWNTEHCFHFLGQQTMEQIVTQTSVGFFSFHMSLIAHEIILILGQINETATAFPLFQLNSLLIHKKLNTPHNCPLDGILDVYSFFCFDFSSDHFMGILLRTTSALMLKRS